MKTKIVLVVGPSGVGKDTLIKHAKKELKENITFVRRYITRKPDKSEKNFFIDKYAFKILKDNNFFISSWDAHDNFYGIARNSIQLGTNIISTSRAMIKNFEKKFDCVYVIHITLNKDDLKARLEKRARETKEEIEKRLNREYIKLEAKNLITFENNKSLDESKVDFINLLKELDKL